jgi:hypothetical protein
MNNTKLKMLKIYNIEETKLDFMGYKIDRNQTGDLEVEFHHIEKKENGGEKRIRNGALLTTRAHSYLHSIESKILILIIK